jgi:hypothetical protein
MKHAFTVKYELDTTVAVAVAAYLDIEHYTYLHSKYTDAIDIIWQDGLKIGVRQAWSYGGLKLSHLCTNEYVPPARFLNYDMRSEVRWIPSVHHVMTTRTDLQYYPDPTGTKTISQLDVELDLPLWLWPLRHRIEARLTRLKTLKDMEDMAMIRRRDQIFGRGNIKCYLADHQFLLHKETFVEHFGPRPDVAGSTAGPAVASASR